MAGPWEEYQASEPTEQKPWELYAAEGNEKDQRPNKPIANTMLESGLLGAEQGLSMGFSDELRGALGAAKDVAFGDSKLSEAMDRYGVNRDQARAMLEKARKDNPLTYASGEAAGSIGSVFIPGLGALGAAKGASLGARALNAAKGGAVLGGITGLGTSQADLTKGEFGKALDDTTSGAKMGALVGGIGTPITEGVGRGVKNFINPENLKNIAADRAVKAATGQNISALRKVAGSTSAGQDIQKAEESLRKAGRDILDSGTLSPFETVEDLAPKLATQRQAIGKEIGNVGKKVDELFPYGGISGEKISNDLLSFADSIPPTATGNRLRDKLAAEASNIQKMGNISFEDAQKIKNQFKYKPTDQDALISNQDVTNQIQKIIGNEMDQAVKVGGASKDQGTRDLLNRYGELKGQYRTFKNVSDAASDRALKNLGNRTPSPSDYGMTGIGAITGAIGSHGGSLGGTALATAATAVAAGALNKLARERGNTTIAYGLNKAAQALENSPEFVKKYGNLLNEAAKRGGPSLMVTHELLRKKFPDYQRLTEESQEQ